MQVIRKDSLTTTSWGSLSLGQVQPVYSQCDGAGSFFPMCYGEPATGDYAGNAKEIARAAEGEDDPHRPPLICVRADSVLPLPMPCFPATSSSTCGCPTMNFFRKCCWQRTASGQAKREREELRAGVPRRVFSTWAVVIL